MGTQRDVAGMGEPVWMCEGWEEDVLLALASGEVFIVMVLPTPCSN